MKFEFRAQELSLLKFNVGPESDTSFACSLILPVLFVHHKLLDKYVMNGIHLESKIIFLDMGKTWSVQLALFGFGVSVQKHSKKQIKKDMALIGKVLAENPKGHSK